MMALSHQWFMQWNLPYTILTDVNHNLNYKTYAEEHDLVHQPNFYKSIETHSVVNHVYPLRIKTSIPYQYYKKNYHLNKKHSYNRESHKEKNTDAGGEGHVKIGGNFGKAVTAALWLTTLTPLPSPGHTVAVHKDPYPFRTLYRWKQIDFEFASPYHREFALKTKMYVPRDVMPLGLEVWKDRVFVTVPNWRGGVPATLTVVPRYGEESPLLRPYPNWGFHINSAGENDCDRIISVFRVSVDACDRLWVLDSGQTNAVDIAKQVCPPALYVFDLHTDTLLQRYEIPKEYILQNSLYSNLLPDSRKQDCSDMHVYLTDVWRYGLLVFRERDKKFWRFNHEFFMPDPLASNYTLHGINFHWTDGIFGLSASKLDEFEDRDIYFHSMSSFNEFKVKASVLRDSSRLFTSANDFHLLGDRGPKGQVSAAAIDRNGMMFFNLVSQDAIGCWNTKDPYKKTFLGVVAQSTEDIVFPNDLKVDKEEKQGVWVLSNRLPMYQRGLLKPDDYNFRILHADVNEAVKGTICDTYRYSVPVRYW